MHYLKTTVLGRQQLQRPFHVAGSYDYSDVESLRTSSRLHFEVLGLEGQVLGLEASSPRKLLCPRLEDSIIFWTVEILLENAWNLAENLRRPFFVFLNWRSPEKKFLRASSPEIGFWRPFFWDRLKNLLKIFFFFSFENTRACVLGPGSWPGAFLFLALA